MDNLDKLFEHIVKAFALKDDMLDIDLVAPATDRGLSISAEKEQAVERERETARELRESFRTGLTEAYRLQQQGTNELELSDQVAQQNSQADALIRYLVSFGLAETRTVPDSPGHYIYHVAVNWDRLRDICTKLDFDLDKTLS